MEIQERKCLFQRGKIYLDINDRRIPLQFTGKSQYIGNTVDPRWIYEFKEVITPDNKNWCKGDTYMRLPYGIVPIFNG